MLSQEQPIMHHNQRDTNRLKTFKLLGNQSDFFRLFFLSFLEIIRSGSGVIQLLHVGIIHKTWAAWSFQRLLHTCMIMYDVVWSRMMLYDHASTKKICKAMWLSRYRYCHCRILLACRKFIFWDSDCPKKCHRRQKGGRTKDVPTTTLYHKQNK